MDLVGAMVVLGGLAVGRQRLDNWPAGWIQALHGRISHPCSGYGGCRGGSTRTCRWRRRMAGQRGQFATTAAGLMGGSMEVALRCPALLLGCPPVRGAVLGSSGASAVSTRVEPREPPRLSLQGHRGATWPRRLLVWLQLLT
jgi:hypothetical protein